MSRTIHFSGSGSKPCRRPAWLHLGTKTTTRLSLTASRSLIKLRRQVGPRDCSYVSRFRGFRRVPCLPLWGKHVISSSSFIFGKRIRVSTHKSLGRAETSFRMLAPERQAWHPRSHLKHGTPLPHLKSYLGSRTPSSRSVTPFAGWRSKTSRFSGSRKSYLDFLDKHILPDFTHR